MAPDLELALAAYAQGLFPMDEPGARELPFFRADPRAVFELDELPAIRRNVHRSLRADPGWTPDLDRGFGEVVARCAAPRADGGGVWLTPRWPRSTTACTSPASRTPSSSGTATGWPPACSAS